MFTYHSVAQGDRNVPQAFYSWIDRIKFLLPDIVLSLALSILCSAALSIVTSWLYAITGIPVVPFLFIMF